jgi:hypothetical protein
MTKTHRGYPHDVTPQQFNLLSAISLAVCQSGAPAERTSTGFGTWGTGWIIVAVAWVAVPRAGWSYLTTQPPAWVRILGLLIRSTSCVPAARTP